LTPYLIYHKKKLLSSKKLASNAAVNIYRCRAMGILRGNRETYYLL